MLLTHKTPKTPCKTGIESPNLTEILIKLQLFWETTCNLGILDKQTIKILGYFFE